MNRRDAAKKPRRKLAFIRWFDASFQAEECTAEELNPGIVIESAGIIAAETDDSISLALDYHPDQGLWRRILHVPKPYIINIKRFSV